MTFLKLLIFVAIFYYSLKWLLSIFKFTTDEKEEQVEKTEKMKNLNLNIQDGEYEEIE